VLYLKLRDDPATVQTLTMQVTPMPAAEASSIANAKPAAPAADAPATDVQDPPDAGAKPAAQQPQ